MAVWIIMSINLKASCCVEDSSEDIFCSMTNDVNVMITSIDLFVISNRLPSGFTHKDPWDLSHRSISHPPLCNSIHEDFKTMVSLYLCHGTGIEIWSSNDGDSNLRPTKIHNLSGSFNNLLSKNFKSPYFRFPNLSILSSLRTQKIEDLNVWNANWIFWLYYVTYVPKKRRT